MKKIFALVLGFALPFLFAVSLSSCKKEKIEENRLNNLEHIKNPVILYCFLRES